MGNVGAYQAMTTLAKKMGGPAVLAAAVAVGGYTVLRPVEVGVKRAVQAVKKKGAPCATKGQVFRVTSDGESSGFVIREGDHYRVLECDGDAVLIEVIGKPDNPYSVPGTFLSSISDFTEAGQ